MPCAERKPKRWPRLHRKSGTRAIVDVAAASPARPLPSSRLESPPARQSSVHRQKPCLITAIGFGCIRTAALYQDGGSFSLVCHLARGFHHLVVCTLATAADLMEPSAAPGRRMSQDQGHPAALQRRADSSSAKQFEIWQSLMLYR
jgi:hypothetical protein